MGKSKVFKVSFRHDMIQCLAIVIAETSEEAKTLLKKEYQQTGDTILIEECKEIEEKGVALVWHQPLRVHPKNN